MKNFEKLIDNITFDWDIHDEQESLFSHNHTKYECSIIYNGNKYTFEYQTTTTPELFDCLYCLLNDASMVDDFEDIFDFGSCMGYDFSEGKEVLRIWDACNDTHKAIHNMFNDDELETLYAGF